MLQIAFPILSITKPLTGMDQHHGRENGPDIVQEFGLPITNKLEQ